MALFNANIVKKAMCDDTITQNFLLSARVYFWAESGLLGHNVRM